MSVSLRLLRLAILPLLLLLGACHLAKVHKEVAELKDSSVLVGTVVSSRADTREIVVAALRDEDDGPRVLHQVLLREPGSYELMVPQGVCRLVAFADRNGNRAQDPGEETGVYGDGRTQIQAGGLRLNLDILLQPGVAPGFPKGLAMPPKATGPRHSSQAGEIASLDSAFFSRTWAERGYWDGVEFFRELGGNVYFLEPYDPTRIPVLFVHGAIGTPRDFQQMARMLDRTRFQAWFYYYPTASPVSSSASLLAKKFWELQMRYHFPRLCLVAHSMGGLVVRTFLKDNPPADNFVSLFISVSTPWGGESLASLGVEYAPAVHPQWEDMRPEGPFIQSLFSRKVGDRIPYYLFFGYKGNRNPLRPNSDGAVTLASQLDRRAQAEARTVSGFDDDHVGILSNHEMLVQFRTLLETLEAPIGGKGAGSLNLKVTWTLEAPSGPRPLLCAQLREKGRKGGGRLLLFNAESTTLASDSIAPGEYEVRVFAAGYLPCLVADTLVVRPGETVEAQVSLRPQGCLHVLVSPRPSTGSLPAGSLSVAANVVQVQRVRLSGMGLTRRLEAPADYQADPFSALLENKDFITSRGFCLNGLPEGEYEVCVEASGFKPLIVKQRVTAGALPEEPVLELLPLGSP